MQPDNILVYWEGDRILSIAGEKVYVQSDFSLILTVKGAGEHDVQVLRDGEKLLLEDVLFEGREFANEDGTTSLRYGISFRVEDATLASKLSYTWNCALDYVRMVRLSLSHFTTEKEIDKAIDAVQILAK